MFAHKLSRTLLFGALALGAACADSPAAPALEVHPAEDPEVRQLSERMVDLRVSPDEPGVPSDNFARFLSLVEDIQEWNGRTGNFTYFANTAECDEPALTSTGARLAPGGLKPLFCGCPQIPLGSPIGYRCVLVDWSCDDYHRACVYECIRDPWYRPGGGIFS